jgi:hypothetical protein
MKLRSEFFKLKLPTEDAFGVEVGIGEILMIGVNVDLCTEEEHSPKFFAGYNNGQELFFHGCIIVLM